MKNIILSTEDSHLTLRPVNDNDIDMLTLWLNKAYILKWYHDAEDWLLEINNRLGTYAWINHFMVMHGSIPIGFCQYYDCYDANAIENWYNVTKAHDTFSIDYLIGDEAYLGKGYGKAVVKLLTDTIRQKEHAKQIIVQPDADNHVSNHVLMANGYLFDEEKGYFCKALV